MHAALRLRILDVLDEFRNLILADRALRDRIALDHRNFNVVIAGEEQAFPLLFRAFFESQLELRMLGANELRKLVKGRETPHLSTGLACNSPWFFRLSSSVYSFCRKHRASKNRIRQICAGCDSLTTDH